MNKVASVGIVLNKRRQVLLVTNRAFGGWSLPGGKVEPGETAGAALRREMLEEVDLSVTVATLLGEWPGTVALGVSVRVYHVLRVYEGSTPRPKERDSKIKWCAFSVLSKDTMFGSFYKERFPSGFDELARTRGIK